MSQIFAYVDQVSPELAEDGAFGRVYMTRDHAMQINTREGLVDQWTRDGRVFVASNPVQGQPESCSATATAILLTDPTIRIGIPAGLIVVPIHVQLSVITVAAKDDIFGVIINNADSFTSGGDAVPMAVRNALINGTAQLRSSGTVNRHYSDTSIVEAGLTNPVYLKIQESQGPTAVATWNPEYNILKGDPMVYIAGPASLLVYAVQETTEALAEFCLSWAELQADTIP